MSIGGAQVPILILFETVKIKYEKVKQENKYQINTFTKFSFEKTCKCTHIVAFIFSIDLCLTSQFYIWELFKDIKIICDFFNGMLLLKNTFHHNNSSWNLFEYIDMSKIVDDLLMQVSHVTNLYIQRKVPTLFQQHPSKKIRSKYSRSKLF